MSDLFDELDVLVEDGAATAGTVHAVWAARLATDPVEVERWRQIAAGTVGRLF